MGTSVKGKGMVTKKSGHKAVSPPAVSNIPPMTPPKPDGVPAPFPYMVESSSGSETSGKLIVGGGEVLVEGSGGDVSKPGNQPSQPAPVHDLTTMMVNAKATVLGGSSTVTAGGKGVALDGESVAMNVSATGGKVAQQTGKMIPQPSSGSSSAAKKSGRGSGKTAGEPVNVVTGAVEDSTVDLSLPGLIPVEWKRVYSSTFADESTPLGRGGWTFSLHQWIEQSGNGVVLRNEDGKNLIFRSAFERCKRLALTQGADGTYFIFSVDTRLTRVFAPVEAGGRAVLREIRDAWGNRVELRYFGNRLTSIVDTAGRELRIIHDERGHVARVDAWAAGAVQQSMTFRYSDAGELAAAVDVLGHAEEYAYDGGHRMVRKALTTGVRFYYEYDEETGRCVKTWGDGGIHPVALEFDDAARTTFIHGTLEPRKFTWNDEGEVLREETLDGDYVVAKTFDEDLHLTAEGNAAGETKRYEYDERGNRVRHVDPAGNVTTWEYRNDLLVRRVGPDGQVLAYGHDERGALTHVVYPSGVTYSFSHDARGRLAAIDSPEGRFLSYAFDERNNLVRETDARGAATQYTYDALGRPLSRTDALGRTTRVEYDGAGNPLAIHGADGSRTGLSYDARRNVARIVDALGQVTTREYGGTGVLTKQTMPNGQSWSFAYDAMERLVQIKNPKAETYELRYDLAGRVERESTFDERDLRYQYNRAGRLSRIEYPDDTWRAFHYDALGNAVLETSPHGAQKYVRDRLGRLQEATVEEYNGKVVVSFERDELGRIVAESQNGRTIRYAYDARGRRISRVLPSGETTRYGYDPLGDLIGVDHDGHHVSVQRDVVGREVRKHVHRGATDIMSAYDAMDRLVDQSVSAPSPLGDGSRRALARRQWAYDGLGRVRAIADERWGISRYEYDSLDQLVSAETGGRRREVFDYDAAGSLQAALDRLPQTTNSWSIRPGNLLVRTDDDAYEYDENHRRRRKIHLNDHKPTGEVTEYVWDCRDRLREVGLPSGDKVLYTYDAFGRRVRKEVVPKPPPSERITAEPERVRVVQFLWDGSVLAAEVDTERGKRVFVHEPGSYVPMLQQEQGEVFTYVNDPMGTPRELVDERGGVAWSGAYSAWGQVVDARRDDSAKRERAVETPFRLLGQYFDDETGLCCTRFRYWDPACARWLSGDPLGIRGGRNLFAFDGSPLGNVDPLGLCATGPPAAAGPSDSSVSSTSTAPLGFRGDRRPPSVIFNEGFRPRGTSTDLLDYAQNNRASVYVGTSTSPEVAAGFAGPGGHVYTVKAPGGIDVNQQLGAYSPFPNEKEIVFPGGVPAGNIVGARQVGPDGVASGPFIPNPNYLP